MAICTHADKTIVFQVFRLVRDVRYLGVRLGHSQRIDDEEALACLQWIHLHLVKPEHLGARTFIIMGLRTSKRTDGFK